MLDVILFKPSLIALKGNFMNKSIYASAAALFIAAPAFAGSIDAPVIEQAPMIISAPQATPVWSGGYVGGNINMGYGSADAAGELESFAAEEGFGKNLSEPDGISGSIRGGYDWQMGRGVFGMGAEYNFGKYEGGPEGGLAFLPDGQGSVEIEKMATIFARAGYAVNDQFLAYGLLGYSRADGTASLGGDSVSADLDGVTFGLGGEYKFTQNWSAYGEYSYTDFGDVEGTEGLLEADLQQIKIGVNYRF